MTPFPVSLLTSLLPPVSSSLVSLPHVSPFSLHHCLLHYPYAFVISPHFPLKPRFFCTPHAIICLFFPSPTPLTLFVLSPLALSLPPFTNHISPSSPSHSPSLSPQISPSCPERLPLCLFPSSPLFLLFLNPTSPLSPCLSPSSFLPQT